MTATAQIIRAPDGVRQKVDYGPGGVDAAVIERAEAVIASYQSEFLVWVQQDLGQIRDAYDRALASPADEREAPMRLLFRLAHDMKGQGGSFGYPLVTDFANALCRYIESRAAFGEGEMAVVRVGIDALRVIVRERLSGNGGAKGQQLSEAIDRVFKLIPAAPANQ